eukprot:scaffold117400_cov46-Phaeocystis_antarctica.AAC.1
MNASTLGPDLCDNIKLTMQERLEVTHLEIRPSKQHSGGTFRAAQSGCLARLRRMHALLYGRVERANIAPEARFRRCVQCIIGLVDDALQLLLVILGGGGVVRRATVEQLASK